MRLIDADAVEKQAYDDVHYHAELEDWEFDVVTHYLDHAPTIDAVPVAQLREMLSNLESECCGDGAETYTTGYRNGHRNGQIELLRYILRIPCGTSEDNRKEGE